MTILWPVQSGAKMDLCTGDFWNWNDHSSKMVCSQSDKTWQNTKCQTFHNIEHTVKLYLLYSEN